MMGRKNVVENEIQEVSVVDPLVDMRVRVNLAIKEKVERLIQAFETEQNKKLEGLVELDQKLKSLKEKKSDLESQRESMLKSFAGVGSKGFNEVDLKLMNAEDDIGRLQKRFDELFGQLTEVPQLDFQLLNLIEGRV